MRKVISGIAELACMFLVLFGLIICMCETPNWDKQLSMILTGAGIMIAGAVFGFISKEVSNG